MVGRDVCSRCVQCRAVALPHQTPQTLAATESDALTRYRKLQIFSGLYVVGCLGAGLLRGDVARITMIDHCSRRPSGANHRDHRRGPSWCRPYSPCYSPSARAKACRIIGWALVPLICIAEVFSWWASLTTNHLGNAFEESLWAFDAALMIVVFALCYTKVEAQVQRFLQAGFVLAIAYVIFMVTVDIPTYVNRWQESAIAGKQYLSIAEGFVDIQRYTVTGSYEEWQYNMVWMTGYFSLAVWISMLMVILPRFTDSRGDT